MQNTDDARVPDSDSDWQAIDIFVFSNGQEYSPPRKYHLQAEDMNLWKSTLGFLAKTQYGPYHSSVDLYTTEGRKVTDPLQLCNGGSYVAVQPPDSFQYAGYEKYLIKASRSWEKRRAKKNENAVETDNTNIITDKGNIPELLEDSSKKEENVILKKVASNVANKDASTIIKPQLLPPQQRNSSIANKQTDKKKSSFQSPLLARKITPSMLPPPNVRNSFKKKDSIKTSNNVQITRPEGLKNSTASAFSANEGNKVFPKSKIERPPSKIRETSQRSDAVLPKKIQELVNVIHNSSIMKVTPTNIDEQLSTNPNTDLKNVVENNELIMVSNVFENLHRDLPSMSVNPNQVQSDIPAITSIQIDPHRQNGATDILPEYYYPNTEGTEHKINSDMKISVPENDENITGREFLDSININHHQNDNDENVAGRDFLESLKIDHRQNHIDENVTGRDFEESLNIDHSVVKNNARENISTEKILIEQYPNRTVTQKTEENINSSSEVKINLSKTYDTIVPTTDKTDDQDSPPRKRSVMIDKAEKSQEETNVGNKLQDHLNSEIIISTCKSTETIKVYNASPPRSSIMTNRVTETQYITQKAKETNDLPPTTAEKRLSDQYKATLKKGDVVNLKLNIEIENQNGNLTKLNDYLNSQPARIIRTEKGSQSNIDNELIAQNNSLLTLITRELRDHQKGDNHRVIIIQSDNCKFCNDNNNAALIDEELNKNYVILLPIEKFEEARERCQCECSEPLPDLQEFNLECPIKPTCSYNTLSKITKVDPQELSEGVATHNTYVAPDQKYSENVVTSVVRKKSVAINEEAGTREPSTLIQEINMKTELVAVSVESISTVRRIVMVEDFTQTDWCDVLLEARILSDGHYTFCLPPLELLKDHKLI